MLNQLDENLKAQDKVVINMIYYLNKKLPKVDNNMNGYIKYLEEKTELKSNRIKTILTINKARRITIKEIFEISKALNIEMEELFKEKK